MRNDIKGTFLNRHPGTGGAVGTLQGTTNTTDPVIDQRKCDHSRPFPRVMHRWARVLALGFLWVGSPLQAQHVLRGHVVDTTGADLAGVDVIVAEAGRRATTDSRGRYTVTDVPSGRFEIVFRRLGYAPFMMFRSFMGDTGTTVVDIQLAAEAVVLPEVETKARGPAEVPVKLREWARRREFNVGGKFWDDSLLRTLEHRRLPEVLQGISGVRIIRGMGKRFLATGGGRAGSGPRSSGGRPIDPRLPKACYAEIYLDGVRLGFAGEPPNLDDMPIHQIAAIELYRSLSEMPVEFGGRGSECGVLAIWTR